MRWCALGAQAGGSRASSPAAPFSTAGWTSPRPRRCTIWSRPRPTAQRRQALRQLDGALGTIYRGWADRLRAAAGPAGGADRLPGRGPAARGRGAGAGRAGGAAARGGGASRRRAARRAAARGFGVRGHRPAECRQVIAGERAGRTRRGDRLGNPRHDARCTGDAGGAGRRAGDAGGHCGPARSDR